VHDTNGDLSVALSSDSVVSGQQREGKPAGGVERLAAVTATPSQKELKLGQDLGVTLTIEAGNRGAYVPNSFKDWVDSCQSGFVVDIYSLQGDRASTGSKGCGSSFLGPGPLAREMLKDYVFLKPGESRSWQTNVTQIRRSPGIYGIRAEYFSHQERIAEVAALPEVRGLMVIGHLPGKPVKIRIR
jgi:hypothetical protein